MDIVDLGLMEYRACWELQKQAHEEVYNGGVERLLLVEHPAVITMGRRTGQEPHIKATKEFLRVNDVDLVESDRGGDVTYHAPGQLVVYPIVRLKDHGLSVSGYVHALEQAVIALVAEFGIAATTDPSAVGVWVGNNKLCAIGVRIRRGVSMHGLALNVTTDLRGFELIVPCGLANRSVTSLEKLVDECPPMNELKRRLCVQLAGALKLNPTLSQ